MNPSTRTLGVPPVATTPPPAVTPNAAEAESRQLAIMLKHAMECLDQDVADWIADAARSETGDPDQSDVMTRLLVDICSDLSPEDERLVLLNGRNPKARALALWWATQRSGDQAVS